MKWRTPSVIWVIPGFGLLSLLLFAFTEDFLSRAFMRTLGLSLLIAGASFLVGALLGFLFGIPRALRVSDAATDEQIAKGQRYSSSSSLEQISDWLTKILIGAGLVQLGALIRKIGDLGDSLGNALVGAASTLKGGAATLNAEAADTVALALIVFFFTAGFLVIYLYTRIDFGPLMARTEDQFISPPTQPPGMPPAPGTPEALVLAAESQDHPGVQ